MFIKFSDKTKKIIVKHSKKEDESSEDLSQNTVYLDESESDEDEDFRIKILKQYENK
tara:strand:+ start:513 stop:683 length:171 start_codon:yes stop_codon:yes gene_type:complete